MPINSASRIKEGCIWLLFWIVLTVFGSAARAGDEVPFFIAPGLFDQSQPETLGLVRAPDTETYTVFAPQEGQKFYNHGAVITEFKGQLYVQWQSSARDEDSSDTGVVYAVSKDASVWSAPQVLAPARSGAIVTSGGWWNDGAQLVAYLNVWPQQQEEMRRGYTEFITTTDGYNWSAPERVLSADGTPVKGVIEQDPRSLPNGRIVRAFHVEPGLTAAPYYTDDPSGIKGWTRGIMQNTGRAGDASREIEPSLFVRADGAVVMIFRDQDSSFKTLASVSHDKAENWSAPVLVNFPDSRSKQSAGNLPNGHVFRVNNPVENRSRFPLVLSLSKDSKAFDRAYLLRAGGGDMQPMRREGRYKRPSYSYPKSAVLGDYLYAVYATNKEDIELTRVPWRKLWD